jgi:hypothetical protein
MNHYLGVLLCVKCHFGLPEREKQVRQVEGMKGNHLNLMVEELMKKESDVHRSKSKALHATDLRYFPLHYLL